MAAAANDDGLMVELEMAAKKQYTEKLRCLFELIDTSGDGKLSLAEFKEVVDKPEGKALLNLLDVQMSDATRLFCILDDGDGAVTFDEFLNGLFYVKGHARSMDVIAIMHDCHRLLTMCQDIQLATCGRGVSPMPSNFSVKDPV